MSNVIAQFHKGKYVNKPIQLGTTLAKDIILEDGDSVEAKFQRLVCNSNGELAFKGKNVVRSVNGVNADVNGNVKVVKPVVDYSSGIDIAYRNAGGGAFPRVTIPQDGLLVLYGNSAITSTEEAYALVRIMDGNTLLLEQAANQLADGKAQVFASINLPVKKGQQVECAVTGSTIRICRLYPYIME